MRKYYKLNTLGFANTYNLIYTETPEQDSRALASGYERITRKEAERLCAAEVDREKHDTAFSGCASSVILPVWYQAAERDWRDDSRMVKNGYIVERRFPK